MEELIVRFFEVEDKEGKEILRDMIISKLENNEKIIDYDDLFKIIDTMNLDEIANLSDYSSNIFVSKVAYAVMSTRIDDYKSKEFINNRFAPEKKVKVIRRRAFNGKYKG